MKKYNPKEIEKKWQKHWEKEKTFEVKEDKKKQKFYSLIEFPYPSGAGLHVGHPRPFTAMDVVSRKKRMEGYNVLYPIGFDAFGLPTENYAIKTGRPPAEVTAENIATFTRQLKSLGYSFDWSRAVDTTDPKYYKWTQWIFLQFFKHGLAYKKNQPINWCPKDKIGLANEEVVNGCCERCGTPVEKRNKEQWMLAITKYADKLLEGLKEVDYIPQARIQQENWIGRSEGATVNFLLYSQDVDGKELERDDVITVFTTRPDTLFGATYLVLSPEHPLLNDSDYYNSIRNWKEIQAYREAAKRQTDMERTAEGREKTGIQVEGLVAVNPATNENIPIWVSDYVLANYGTGAIMAVPAHDERDFEFAKKFGLPIKEVVLKVFGHEQKDEVYRDGAIAVLIRNNQVLILLDKKFEFYRLPGGGIEKDENLREALAREIKEETGYQDFEIVESLGQVEAHYNNVRKQLRRSTIGNGFLVRLKSDQRNELSLEDQPMYEGQWVDIDTAIKKLAENPEPYGEDEFVRRVKYDVCFSGEGRSINSDFLDGLPTAEAKEKMIRWLEDQRAAGQGRKVQYKLRDWVFSRQRYWGEPIPLVFCENCAENSKKSTSAKATAGRQETRNKKVIVVHGLGGDSKENWFPWIKKELSEKGYEVLVPDLPNADRPSLVEWLKTLQALPVKKDDELIVIGHSLGAPVACQFIQKMKFPVKKLILVAPTGEQQTEESWRNLRAAGLDEQGVTAIKSFNTSPVDWKKLRSLVGETMLYLSDNDPYIPTTVQEHYKELHGRVRWFQNKGHFNKSAGVTKFPEILDDIITGEDLNPGWVPLPESELPLKLPKVEKYQPTDTGESPLAAMTDWVNTKCPKCSGPARRETDTMPNWAGSSWYFLRYCDPNNDKEFASMEKLRYWMDGQTVIPNPRRRGEESSSQDSETRSLVGASFTQDDKFVGGVDWYNGGMEHTVLHLLYSRFWNQFLYDIGLVPTSEPYKKRTSHGLIMGPDGEKMSKSRGNVVNPDEMIEQYGADALRAYIMFMGPFDQPVAWDTNGLVGVRRFLDRVWNLQDKVSPPDDGKKKPVGIISTDAARIHIRVHNTIKKVTYDIEKMAFNTAVAKLMELVNEMVKYPGTISHENYAALLKLLSPFAPHITEELWEKFGDDKSISQTAWPVFDEALIKRFSFTIAIQVNGKVRDQIEVAAETEEEEVKNLARSSEKVQKWLEGKEPKKVIYVKGKLVSIVI